MRPMYALYVGGMGARGKNFYNDLACQYGYEKEAKEIQDLYLDGHKRDAEAKVPLEWLEAGNLVGPESYVKERIAAFARPASPTCRSPPPPTTRPPRSARSRNGCPDRTRSARQRARDHGVGRALEARDDRLEGG